MSWMPTPTLHSITRPRIGFPMPMPLITMPTKSGRIRRKGRSMPKPSYPVFVRKAGAKGRRKRKGVRKTKASKKGKGRRKTKKSGNSKKGPNGKKKSKKGRRKPRAVLKTGVYTRKGFLPLLGLIPALIAAGKAAATAAALGAAGSAGGLLVNKIAGKGGRKHAAKLHSQYKGQLNQSVMDKIGPALMEGLSNALKDGLKQLGAKAVTAGGSKLFSKIFGKRKAGMLRGHWKNYVKMAKKGDLDPSAFEAFGDILALDPSDFSSTFQQETKKSFIDRLISGAGKLLSKKATQEIGGKVLDKALEKVSSELDKRLAGTGADPATIRANTNAAINEAIGQRVLPTTTGTGLIGLGFRPPTYVM